MLIRGRGAILWEVCFSLVLGSYQIPPFWCGCFGVILQGKKGVSGSLVLPRPPSFLFIFFSPHCSSGGFEVFFVSATSLPS